MNEERLSNQCEKLEEQRPVVAAVAESAGTQEDCAPEAKPEGPHQKPGEGDGVIVEAPSGTPPLLVIPGGNAGKLERQAWPILGLKDAFKDAEMPPWAIQDLVMSATVTLISAHPHGMKSLSWLYACLEGVLTKKVFGHFAAPNLNNVLFVETEDPEWLVKKRIQGFAKGLGLKQGQNVPGFHFTCPGPFGLADEVKRFERLIDQLDLDLLVLSTLQNTLDGKDWNDQKEMAGVLKKLVNMARLCPIVVLTHSPQDQRQKRAAGTITIGANCATHVHYDKSIVHKTGETFVHLMVDSKAGATDTQFTLKLLRDEKDSDPVSSVRGLVYVGKGKKGKQNAKKAILDALEDDPAATCDEIAVLVGCSERYVQRIKKKQEK